MKYALIILLLAGCDNNEHKCVNGQVYFKLPKENFWRPNIDACLVLEDK